MARNKLSDLNNHLFAALERLNDDELTTEQIAAESQRAEAIIGVANQIINNAKIAIDAMKLISNDKLDIKQLPETFGFKTIE